MFKSKNQKSLSSTQKYFNETKSLSGVELKEYSFLYLIINDLDLIKNNLYLIKDVKLFSKENKLVFDAVFEKLQNDENKYNAFKELRKIKKRAGKEGQYKVNFLLKDFGSMETKALVRMYAKGSSLQYLSREYRKALVCDEYTDIDIKNAHPSLISQIFKEQGLKCKTLDDYVANRGKFLEVVDKTLVNMFGD